MYELKKLADCASKQFWYYLEYFRIVNVGLHFLGDKDGSLTMDLHSLFSDPSSLRSVAAKIKWVALLNWKEMNAIATVI
jgi:hypothetical protein